MKDTAWGTVARLVERLDAASAAAPEAARLLRVLKISDEAGEVAQRACPEVGTCQGRRQRACRG